MTSLTTRNDVKFPFTLSSMSTSTILLLHSGDYNYMQPVCLYGKSCQLPPQSTVCCTCSLCLSSTEGETIQTRSGRVQSEYQSCCELHWPANLQQNTPSSLILCILPGFPEDPGNSQGHGSIPGPSKHASMHLDGRLEPLAWS